MCRKGIIAIISERFLGSDNKEITDWWMMRNLLAIDISTIWIMALKSFTNHWVKRFEEKI